MKLSSTSLSILIIVLRRLSIALLFVVLSSFAYGQKRLTGLYDTFNRQFLFTDPNVIVKPFVGNRAAFMIKGKNPLNDTSNRVGFIDTTGKVVIRPVYIDCSSFYKSFALAKKADGTVGVIDRSGKTIIPFGKRHPYDISFCRNGLIVLRGEKYAQPNPLTVVDKKNKVVIGPGIYTAFAQAPQVPMDGLIQHANDNPDRGYFWHPMGVFVYAFENFCGAKKNAKWCIIDRNGKEIVPAKFGWIGIFKNGFAPFETGGKYGVVDTTGKEIVPATYDNLELSGNGFVIAILNKRWGVLSVSGRTMISFRYDVIYRLGGDAFAAYVAKNGVERAECGLIDTSEKIIIPFENGGIERFGSGYSVYKNNGKRAIFDSAGLQRTRDGCVRQPEYPVWNMCDQGYIVYNEKKRDFDHYDEVDYDHICVINNKVGLINGKGEQVIEAQYDSFGDRVGQAIGVEKDKKWGIMSVYGKILAPFAYDSIEQIQNSLFYKASKNGKYGIIDQHGKIIAGVKYDDISNDDGCGVGMIRMVVNGLTGLMDNRGKIVYRCKYATIDCKNGKVLGLKKAE